MPAYSSYSTFGSNQQPNGNGSPLKGQPYSPGGAFGKPLSPVQGGNGYSPFGKQLTTMGPGSFGQGLPHQGNYDSMKDMFGSVSQLGGQQKARPKAPGSSIAGMPFMGGSIWDRPREQVGGGEAKPSLRDQMYSAAMIDWQNDNRSNMEKSQLGRSLADQWNQRRDGDFEGMMRGIDEGNDRVRGYADDMMRKADEEGNAFRDEVRGRVEMTESEFKDRSAQDASAAAFGMDRQMESELQSIESGVGPDGMPMSQEQQQAARTEMTARYKPQKQAAMTGIMSQFNSAMASLRTQGTGLIAGAGQYALGNSQQARQAALGFIQGSEQMSQAAKMQAYEFRMNGDMAGYQMLMDTPFAPSSLLSTLSALLAADKAGASSSPAVPGSFNEVLT